MRCDALAVTYEICFCHFISSEKIIPKCLCSVTCNKFSPLNFMDNLDLFLFKEILIKFVLRGLKSTSHLLAQFSIFVRSVFKSFSAILKSLYAFNKIVSSAYKLILLWIVSSRSLIKIKNNRGPRMEPSGTPARSSRSSENLPPMTTFCFRLLR